MFVTLKETPANYVRSRFSQTILLVFTRICKLLGYAMSGLRLAPTILLSLPYSNNKVKSNSKHFLSPSQLNGVLQSVETIKTLSPDLQRLIRRVFASGYNEEMQALTAFGGACVLAGLLMWEKKPRRME